MSIQRLWDDERGQTLHDYVVGISIFMLVAFAALGYFPGVLASFQSDAGGDVQAQSERVSSQIVTNASTSGAVNELNLNVLEEITDRDEDELRDRYVLEQTSNVNITVETLDGSGFVANTSSGAHLTTESNYYGNSAGTSARVVTLTDTHRVSGCQPACRLVVRVW